MTAVQQVLVLSSGRSGSTLLDRLLGRHPQLVSLGEVLQWPKNLALDTACSCGEPMSRCPFWQAVAQRLDERLGLDLQHDPYGLDLGLIGASHVRDEAYYSRRRVWGNRLWQAGLFAGQRIGLHVPLPPVQRQLRHSLALYEAVRAVAGVPVAVDSSKQYLRGIALYRQSPQNTRLLVLVRDGRAVLHSRLQSGVRCEEAVQRWVHYYRRMLPRLAASVPDAHVQWVRYEDLATDPQGTLAHLLAALGLACPANLLDLPETQLHMAEGNPMRLRPLGSVRLDRRWETGLDAASRAYFARHAGDLNRRLGYGDD